MWFWLSYSSHFTTVKNKCRRISLFVLYNSQQELWSWSNCSFLLQLKLFFTEVTFAKPKSSRNSSIGKSSSFTYICTYYGGKWESSLSCFMSMNNDWCCFIFTAEAFAVCENYSPPEGFNEKDLHRLLEKVGSPSGADDLGNLTNHLNSLCFIIFICIFTWLSLFFYLQIMNPIN